MSKQQSFSSFQVQIYSSHDASFSSLEIFVVDFNEWMSFHFAVELLHICFRTTVCNFRGAKNNSGTKAFLQNALASTKGVSDCAHKHTQDINELVIQYHSPDKVIFCIACNLTTRRTYSLYNISKESASLTLLS